jgi:hypothetical protein
LHGAKIRDIFRVSRESERNFRLKRLGDFSWQRRTPHSPTDGSQFKDFDERDAILLERVAEKLVRFGQQVGVTPEEMISLLDSGISSMTSSRSLPRSLREPPAVELKTIFYRDA